MQININELHPQREQLLTNSESKLNSAQKWGLVAVGFSTLALGSRALFGDSLPPDYYDTLEKVFEMSVKFGPAAVGGLTLTSGTIQYLRAGRDRFNAARIGNKSFQIPDHISYETIPDMVSSLPLLPEKLQSVMSGENEYIGIQGQNEGENTEYIVSKKSDSQGEWSLQIGKYTTDGSGDHYGFISDDYIDNVTVTPPGGKSKPIRLSERTEDDSGISIKDLPFVEDVMSKQSVMMEVVRPVEYESREDFYNQLQEFYVATDMETIGVIERFNQLFRLIEPENQTELFHRHFILLQQLNACYRDNVMDEATKGRMRVQFRDLASTIPLSRLAFTSPDILREAFDNSDKAEIKAALEPAYELMENNRLRWEETADDTELHTEIVFDYHTDSKGRSHMTPRTVTTIRPTAAAIAAQGKLSRLRPQRDRMDAMLAIL